MPTEPVKKVKEDTLWRACANGDVARIEKYIENKGAMNECDGYKMTLLHHAVHGGQVAVVKMLLAAGADADAQDAEGWSPLLCAVDKSNAEIVLILCAHGADPCTKDTFKRSLLHIAAMHGSAEVITILKEEGGASSNIKTVAGMIPLHYAAQNGHLDACKALKPSATNLASLYSEKTPFQLAEEAGHKEVAEFLKSLEK